MSQTLVDEWNRVRGRMAGLLESFGLPERQERAAVSTMKSLTYDAQKSITAAVEGDPLALALNEARAARQEARRGQAILEERRTLGKPDLTADEFLELRLSATEAQCRELESLKARLDRASV